MCRLAGRFSNKQTSHDHQPGEKIPKPFANFQIVSLTGPIHHIALKL